MVLIVSEATDTLPKFAHSTTEPVVSSRRHRHHHHDPLPLAAEVWTRAVEGVDLAALTEHLNLMPASARRRALAEVGAPSAPKAKPAMVRQVISRLRSARGDLRDPVIGTVCTPLLSALDSPEVDAETWRTLAGTDDMAAALSLLDNPDTADLLLWVAKMDPTLQRLMAAACMGVSGYGRVVAMRVAASYDEQSEELLLTAAAIDAGMVMMEDDPDLDPQEAAALPLPDGAEPAAPLTLEQISPVGRALALGWVGEPAVGREEVLRALAIAVDDRVGQELEEDLAEAEAALVAEELDEADGAPDEAVDPRHWAEETIAALGGGDLTSLTGQEWDVVANLAHQLAQDLAQGRVPRVSQARLVLTFVVNVKRATNQLGSRSREELAAALEQWSQRGVVPVERRWLLRLAEVSGPESLAHEVAVVAAAARDAARTGDHGSEAGLRALLELVVASGAAGRGEVVDLDELMAARDAATSGLPGLDKVVFAAAAGMLTVPDEDPQDTTAAQAEAGVSSARGAGPVLRPGEDDPTLVVEDPDEVVDKDPDEVVDEDSDPGPIDEGTDSGLGGEGGPGQAGMLADAAGDHAQDGAVADLDLSQLNLAPALAKFVPDARPPADPKPEPDPVPQSANGADAHIAPDWSWGSSSQTGLDAALIGQGRYGLAADLAAAAGAPPASVAARRLGAYAAVLTDRTGDMATEFSQRAALVDRESLADDRAGQLLAWAAATKAAALAPFAGPAEVLSALDLCVSSSPALTAVGEVMKQAAHIGVAFLPDAAAAAGATSDAHARAQESSAKAADLLARSRTRTINYVPAGDVYRAWLAEDGELGAVLRAVIADDPDIVADVRSQVVAALRRQGPRAVDVTFARVKGKAPRTHERITAGPRQKLIGMWDEVVDLAAQWVDARERITATETEASVEWAAAAVHRLRSELSGHRQDATADLTRLAAAAGIEADVATGPVSLLADALAAFDGIVPTGAEPPVAFVEHAELLTAAVHVDPDTLVPVDRVDLEALVAVAQESAADLAAMYEHLATAGAHDLSKVVVDAAVALDPAVGRDLKASRAKDLAAWDARTRAEVSRLADTIDLNRADGVLTDETWARATETVEALSAAGRHDYARILAAAEGLGAELAGERDRLIAAAVRDLEAAGAEAGVVEHLSALVTFARDGQVTAALEGLQQAREGNAVAATTTTEASHLTRFFPIVAQVLSRRADGQPALERITAALRDEQHTPVTTDLAAAGLDLLALSGPRRKQARDAVNAWIGLSSRQKGATITEPDMLKIVLAQAGITFKSWDKQSGAPEGQTHARLWGVDLLGSALTPVLGSSRSPGSDTLDVLLVRKAPTPASVIESLATAQKDRTVVMLWLDRSPLTPSEWRGIAEVTRGQVASAPPVLVVDASVLVYLAGQAEPRARTLEQLTLAFTATNPYRDTAGDTAPEMFYGRIRETAAIIDRDGPSFVSGGRQLGKSALLRHAARQFRRASADHVAVVLSVFSAGKGTTPAEQVWSDLWPELVEASVLTGPVPDTDVAAAVYAGVRDWVRSNHERRLLLLLDEADDFLDADAAGDRFANVEWMRRLMVETGRAVKVVLAGLHTTARFESLPNQPLSHLGRPVVVGPLAPAHARALLTVPLAAIGYEFDSPATVARVLARANNMPAQLQLIGAALAERMATKPVVDGPPLSITADDVVAAFTPRLNAALREKFTLTLALDPRYKVIALNVALAAYESTDASLSLTELSARCHQTWPEGFAQVGKDAFRGLVTECVDLGVLARDGSRYRLRTPAVRRLLGTEEEVFNELAGASEDLSVPAVYDGAIFRRGIAPRGVVSPLTERQLGALFAPGSGVVVVAGCRASGVDKVIGAISAAAPATPAAGHLVRADQARGPQVAHEVARAATRTRVLVDARGLGHDRLTELLAAAEDAVAATSVEVTVIVVCGPAGAGAWASVDNVVQLERIGVTGVRLLAGADLVPLHDTASQERVVTGLGGWWQLVARVQERFTDPTNRSTGAELIEAVAAEVAADPGKLARAAGLVPGTALTLAFELVTDMAGSGWLTEQEWAGLLAEDDELPTLLGEAGLASTAEVVTALATLGVLVSREDGTWGPEPMVVADLRAAKAVTA